LDRLLHGLGFSDWTRTMGLILFTVSFPTFYYGTIGFVDPPSVSLITLSAHLTLRRRYVAVGAIGLLAVLVKETNAVIALLPLLHAWANRALNLRTVGLTVGCLAGAAVTTIALRLVTPFPNPEFFWTPYWSSMSENLTRPRALLSLLLTLGIPGALAAASVAAGRASKGMDATAFRFLIAGCGLCVCLYLYSLTSAYADGRIIWASYPFIIPLALTWFELPSYSPGGPLSHPSEKLVPMNAG
jgi:hypothetical protein